MYLRYGIGSAVSLASIVSSSITQPNGVWVPPTGVTNVQDVATAEHAFVDSSSAGGPDFITTLSGTGNWKYRTDDNPNSKFSAILDLGTDHMNGEYMAIATALSGNSYCGGFIMRVVTPMANPSEQCLLDFVGVNGAAHNTSNGNYAQQFMLSYYNTPQKLACVDGSIQYGATNTSWTHIQWLRKSDNFIHYYISSMSGAFKGVGDYEGTGDGPYGQLWPNTGLQVGHGGSIGPGNNMRLAMIYTGRDATLAESALQDIHNNLKN